MTYFKTQKPKKDRNATKERRKYLSKTAQISFADPKLLDPIQN
jgi:hypothetical protein